MAKWFDSTATYFLNNCPEDDANFKCKWKDEDGNEVEGWNYNFYKGKDLKISTC